MLQIFRRIHWGWIIHTGSWKFGPRDARNVLLNAAKLSILFMELKLNQQEVFLNFSRSIFCLAGFGRRGNESFVLNYLVKIDYFLVLGGTSSGVAWVEN